MKYVAILALEGVFDSSLALTLDILRSARTIHNLYCGGTVAVDSVVCGVTSGPLVTGAGLELQVDTALAELEALEFLIVPGFGLFDPERLEAVLQSHMATEVTSALRDAHARGVTIAASCCSTFLLAESGLLDNVAATTSWWLADAFRARYPAIDLQSDRMLISSEGIICAGAALAQADLMIFIVSRLYGEETARLVAHYLLIDKRDLQSQYVMSGLVNHRHPEVARAEHWVRENIANEFSVSDLAAAVGVSTRTLARRIERATGAGPLKFIQQLRIEHAIHLLQTTSRSFESISLEIGYRDASSFRRLLQRHTGKSPGQFRAVNASLSSE